MVHFFLDPGAEEDIIKTYIIDIQPTLYYNTVGETPIEQKIIATEDSIKGILVRGKTTWTKTRQTKRIDHLFVEDLILKEKLEKLLPGNPMDLALATEIIIKDEKFIIQSFVFMGEKKYYVLIPF